MYIGRLGFPALHIWICMTEIPAYGIGMMKWKPGM